EIEEPAAKDLHRLRLVLQLRALVLALDDEAGRTVLDLDGAVRRVDALTARPTARGDRDLEVLLVDLHVALVGLGHRGRGGGREEEQLDLPLERGSLFLELGQLELDELAELGIGERLFVLADLLFELAIAAERLHERLDVGPLLVQLRELMAVCEHPRITKEI